MYEQNRQMKKWNNIPSTVNTRIVYNTHFFTGGTGPTADNGWGCMLRCGQMIFAQALVCRHLGRG